ncbi:MAG: amidophosphoribosyltransferase [Candidatus Saganbacteria bacterium]|uniref:Amidophosphoribosyltransferase n=1 Tax=Candidatus Saganbacteria bacterium TaxID=2575572 RepID=A0A833NRJ1_UNCSA|nr:MAG: amidophosphoribosyltransferase [Candidatus Saganbacteria bacterium]
MREACGVFGIYSFKDDSPFRDVYYGLFALQHRGQESAGIAVSNLEDVKVQKGMGLVNQVFNEQSINQLHGKIAIGHVRYSTTGSSNIENAQPILINSKYGPVALAHNGNLINTEDLRCELKERGLSFIGTSDSELIAALISTSDKSDIESAIIDMLNKIKGAYSLVILTKDSLIALRDPNGIRPLSIGKTENAYVFSSETCGFDIIGAHFIRDINNGELVIIKDNEMRSRIFSNDSREALCIFEFIYFARPDSIIHGRSLYESRVNMGKYLAKEHPVRADLVIPVPESGIPAAIGYADESGIPYGEGLIKNRYVGRTFIEPNQEMRSLGVRIKLNPIQDAVRGKKVIVVDDSIVRGTTSRQIVKLLKEAGASEVHMRVSSPKILNPCYYGIDTATRAELIAANLSLEGIAKYLDVDSLGYLSLNNLVKAVALPEKRFCLACFNDDYPVKVPEKMQSLKLFFK